MSDPNPPKIQLPGKQPEPGMEKRLMLAFGLMGLVLIVSQYLMPPPPDTRKGAAPSAAKQQQQAPSQPQASAPAAPRAAKGKTPAAAPAAAVVQAEKEEIYRVQTALYQITFSNRGAVVKSWILRKFTDHTGKPLELVNPAGAGKVVPPMAIRFHAEQSAEALNNGLWTARVSGEGRTLEFEYAVGEWRGVKRFVFHPDSYLAQVHSEVYNSGVGKPHLLYWRGGFGDASVIGAAASQQSVRFDLNAGALQTLGPSDGPQSHRGRFSFAGISDSYFAAVALPETAGDFEIHTLTDQLENKRDKKMEANAGVAVGGAAANTFQLFVGPKDTALMRSISPRLEQLVDFGYFALIAKPLFLALRWMHDNFLHNWGWSIIVITIIINFLLLPLKISSLKSMKKMSVLQPRIAAINEKYKGMSLTDPRKQQQNQEVMELYKEHGVNPMGGCVPMMLQIPFFIAFYKVLSAAIELRGAEWLWVTDLSRPETLALRVLPLAMIASQFIMQKMTPSTTADPAQQRVMLMMPAFMGFMFYGVSSGLVLYWITGNIVGIAQQWFFNRMFPASAPAVAPAPAAKKKK